MGQHYIRQAQYFEKRRGSLDLGESEWYLTVCLRRASLVVQVLPQRAQLTPGWSFTWLASMWTDKFCLVFETCKQSLHWNSLALWAIILDWIILSSSSYPESTVTIDISIIMISGHMFSQGLSGGTNPVAILTGEGGASDMASLNVNRHPIFVSRSVRALTTTVP